MNKGYIYLIHKKEYIDTNENVYKIGRTTRSIAERLNEYTKGSILIFSSQVNDCVIVEKLMILKFKMTFNQLPTYGIESFNGDHLLMIDEIANIIDFYNNYDKPGDIIDYYNNIILKNTNFINNKINGYHICNICNFKSTISSNYKKHLLSYKHIKLTSSINTNNVNTNDVNTNDVNTNDVNTNDVNTTDVNTTDVNTKSNYRYKCQYCIKTFKDRSNRHKHSKTCVIKYNILQQNILANQEQKHTIIEKHNDLLNLEREKVKKLQIKNKLLSKLLGNIIKNTNNSTYDINNINQVLCKIESNENM